MPTSRPSSLSTGKCRMRLARIAVSAIDSLSFRVSVCTERFMRSRTCFIDSMYSAPNVCLVRLTPSATIYQTGGNKELTDRPT
jgi:hypothetical protein